MTNSAPLILTDESHAVFRLHFCLLLFTFDLTDGRGRDNVVYGPDFVDEVLVLFEREGLRAVGECAFGVVVNFDYESERLAYVGENLHAVFTESLEGVRGGARLECAAAEEARAAAADGLRDLERLLAALDGARARDDRHFVAADCGVADLHD